MRYLFFSGTVTFPPAGRVTGVTQTRVKGWFPNEKQNCVFRNTGYPESAERFSRAVRPRLPTLLPPRGRRRGRERREDVYCESRRAPPSRSISP